MVKMAAVREAFLKSLQVSELTHKRFRLFQLNNDFKSASEALEVLMASWEENE